MLDNHLTVAYKNYDANFRTLVNIKVYGHSLITLTDRYYAPLFRQALQLTTSKRIALEVVAISFGRLYRDCIGLSENPEYEKPEEKISLDDMYWILYEHAVKCAKESRTKMRIDPNADLDEMLPLDKTATDLMREVAAARIVNEIEYIESLKSELSNSTKL